MQSKAIEKSTKMQVEALEKQKKFVYDNLNPAVVNEAAKAADIERTQNRLALQAATDPALSQLRYTSQNALAEAGRKVGEGQGDILANQLFEDVSQPEDVKQKALRTKLIDAALDEIDAGASLPPDVQAELVKAGLERSGTVGTGSSSRGLAGELTRRLIGNEAITLKQARQDQATRLGLASQEMANQRLGLLSGVFPQLKGLESQNLATQQSLFATASNLPEAGLGGSDIANIFLGRVGATTQIAQSVAETNAKAALDSAAAWSGALGNIGKAAGGVAKDAGVPSTGDLLATLFKKK